MKTKMKISSPNKQKRELWLEGPYTRAGVLFRGNKEIQKSEGDMLEMSGRVFRNMV